MSKQTLIHVLDVKVVNPEDVETLDDWFVQNREGVAPEEVVRPTEAFVGIWLLAYDVWGALVPRSSIVSGGGGPVPKNIGPEALRGIQGGLSWWHIPNPGDINLLPGQRWMVYASTRQDPNAQTNSRVRVIWKYINEDDWEIVDVLQWIEHARKEEIRQRNLEKRQRDLRLRQVWFQEVNKVLVEKEGIKEADYIGEEDIVPGRSASPTLDRLTRWGIPRVTDIPSVQRWLIADRKVDLWKLGLLTQEIDLTDINPLRDNPKESFRVISPPEGTPKRRGRLQKWLYASREQSKAEAFRTKWLQDEDLPPEAAVVIQVELNSQNNTAAIRNVYDQGQLVARQHIREHNGRLPVYAVARQPQRMYGQGQVGRGPGSATFVEALSMGEIGRFRWGPMTLEEMQRFWLRVWAYLEGDVDGAGPIRQSSSGGRAGIINAKDAPNSLIRDTVRWIVWHKLSTEDYDKRLGESLWAELVAQAKETKEDSLSQGGSGSVNAAPFLAEKTFKEVNDILLVDRSMKVWQGYIQPEVEYMEELYQLVKSATEKGLDPGVEPIEVYVLISSIGDVMTKLRNGGLHSSKLVALQKAIQLGQLKAWVN